MPDKLWYRPWEILVRLAIAVASATFVWMKLPMAHTLPTLLVLIQLVLYLTLLVWPPGLRTVLLCDQIDDRAQATDTASIELAVPSSSVGQHKITVQVVELWGTAADKSVKVKFARELANARMRNIHNSFLISFVPIVMVVALTCILSILQQNLVATHAGGGEVAFAIPFLQGLIGLIPFVWVIGQLLGEITCHRDMVFKALN